MYERLLKQDFENSFARDPSGLWGLLLVFRFDITRSRFSKLGRIVISWEEDVATFCINALACRRTVALPETLDAAVCISTSGVYVVFSAWRPGSPGGQQVWLLPLLSSSAFLLANVPELLIFPFWKPERMRGKICRINYDFLAGFYRSSGEKAHSPWHIVTTNA